MYQSTEVRVKLTSSGDTSPSESAVVLFENMLHFWRKRSAFAGSAEQSRLVFLWVGTKFIQETKFGQAGMIFTYIWCFNFTNNRSHKSLPLARFWFLPNCIKDYFLAAFQRILYWVLAVFHILPNLMWFFSNSQEVGVGVSFSRRCLVAAWLGQWIQTLWCALSHIISPESLFTSVIDEQNVS